MENKTQKRLKRSKSKKNTVSSTVHTWRTFQEEPTKTKEGDFWRNIWRILDLHQTYRTVDNSQAWGWESDRVGSG